MNESTQRWASITLRACILGVLAFGGLTLAGCGEDDPCAGKVCEFGTCDSNSGQCVNLETCNVDSECIPGYLCGQEGTCVAQNTCEADSDCSTGVCEDGACVNPDQCEQNSDCLSRTFCDDGTCRPDPCNNVQCQRGVCQRGTDNCVSADSCTQRTEVADCVAGQKCADGNCESAETFCDNITCERGVCSFAEGGCINAMNCEGSNENCKEGFFCNDMDACQRNLCVENSVNCGDDGVCMPSSGKCKSAMTCTSTSDCSGSDLCVSQDGQSDEGACVPEANACGNAAGDGGCPGNQICNYDPDTLTAECAEPEVCETSVDCKDGRQCGGRNCLAQVSCKSDRLEPNNTMEEATPFTEVADDLLVKGSLCQGDTDLFTFDTTNIVDPTTSGEIVVSVTVPDRDIGLGTMSATLTGPDGSQLGSDSLSLMADDGSLQMTTSLGIPDHGTYSVAVEPGGQMTSAGLSYDMTVNVVPQGALQACQDARTITPGQRISDTMESSTTSGIGASCISDDESSSEIVYALELDESRQVTITADPVVSSGDPVVSLRSRCLEAGSERACSNDNGEGDSESLSTVLSAGTHYVVVQSPGDGTLGEFELTVDSPYSTVCGPSDTYCVDGSTSAVCTLGGGQFAEISCDDTCNPSSGECFPPAGDRCGDAPQITNESMSKMREIDLRQYNNNYSLSQGGCIDGQPRTGGPDAAYSVTIPANTTLTASVSYGASAQGALYFVDDCSDVQGTCQKGQQGDDDTPSEEEIFFINDTDSEVTKTLIVDTAAEQRLGETQVNFSYAEIICTPGGGRCLMSGNAELCNAKGTAYTTIETCNTYTCQNGACPGDTCAAPFNVTQAARSSSNGVTYGEFNWGDFTNAFQGGGCGIDSSHTEGTDTVLQADLKAGEVVTATVYSDDSSPLADPSIYIQDTCGSLSNSTCLDGEETNNETASAAYRASSDQTVYIVGDADDTASSEEISMEVNIQQSDCDPATYQLQCDGSGNLQLCSDVGLYETYSCQGGCSNATCGTPTGAIPEDAKPVSDGDTVSQDSYTGTNDVDPVGNNATGSCTFGENTAGADWTYKVDLQANETLTADYTGTGFFSGGSCCDIMYILQDYTDTTTCLGAVDNDGSLTYTAGNSPETVYVVMDHDDYTNNTFYGFSLDITIN